MSSPRTNPPARFGRHLVALVAFAVVGAGCGGRALEADVAGDIGPTTTVTSPEPAPLPDDPHELLALAADTTASLERYAFTITAVVELPPESAALGLGEELTIVVPGFVDSNADAVRYEVDLSQLGPLDDPGVALEGAPLELLAIGGETYARGVTEALAGVAADPEAWYQLEGDGLVGDAFVGDRTQPAELLRLLEGSVRGSAIDLTVAGGNTVLSFAVSRHAWMRLEDEHPGSLVDLGLAEGGGDVAVDVAVNSDALATQVEVSAGATPDAPWMTMRVDIDPAASFPPIVPPTDVLTLPEPQSRPEPPSEPSLRPIIIEPDADGVMFRAGLYAGEHDLFLSVEANGRVVQVTDTSVFATPADFTTWRISPEAVQRLVTVIEESGLIGHPDANRQFGTASGQNASISFNGGLVIEVTGIDATTGLTDEHLERRQIFAEVFELVTDHDWLGDQIVEPPRPFVPDGLTVLVTEAKPTQGAVEWPLDAAIADVVVDGAFCLSGDDVAPVFAVLDGQNWAHLAVIDDGELWHLNVNPQLPGYALHGNRCP